MIRKEENNPQKMEKGNLHLEMRNLQMTHMLCHLMKVRLCFKHVGEYGETRKLYSDSSSDDDDQDGGHEDFIPCA
jgi:hypothetical protein